MKRPPTRRVVVVLGPRRPADPKEILEAVATAFRPQDVTLYVGTSAANKTIDGVAVIDERLETIAKRAALEALRQSSLEARTAVGRRRKIKHPPTRGQIVAEALARTAAWVRAALAAGYRVTVFEAARGIASVFQGNAGPE